MQRGRLGGGPRERRAWGGGGRATNRSDEYGAPAVVPRSRRVRGRLHTPGSIAKAAARNGTRDAAVAHAIAGHPRCRRAAIVRRRADSLRGRRVRGFLCRGRRRRAGRGAPPSTVGGALGAVVRRVLHASLRRLTARRPAGGTMDSPGPPGRGRDDGCTTWGPRARIVRGTPSPARGIPLAAAGGQMKNILKACQASPALRPPPSSGKGSGVERSASARCASRTCRRGGGGAGDLR